MFYTVKLKLDNTCYYLPSLLIRIKPLWVYVGVCVSKIACQTWMCSCICVDACLHTNFHYLSLSWNSICSSPEWNCIDCWLRCRERGWKKKTTRKDCGAVGREKERVTNRGKVLACAVAASCRSIGDFKSEKMKGGKQRARDGRDETSHWRVLFKGEWHAVISDM